MDVLMLMDRMRNPYQPTFGGVVYGSAHADGQDEEPVSTNLWGVSLRKSSC